MTQHSEEALLMDVADTHDNNPHGLGRLFLADDRDQEHLMSARLMAAPVTVLPSYKYYTPGQQLDQGQTSKCVGYSWQDFLSCSPIRQGKDTKPETIYCGAQALDPWPGDCTNPQYEGSTVRAGAKYLQSQGYLSEYVWAYDVTTIAHWLLSGKGPVVLGTRWYNSMFKADKDAHVTVDINSGLSGGHAFLCIGYNSKTRMFKFQNSWGSKWGAKGCFWMTSDDLGLLLSQQGEAVTATEVKKG
jgi:hypothetical protein